MAARRDRRIVRLGGTSFHPDESRLTGPDGVEIHLRPRSAKVLATLVAKAGRIVSKNDLIASAWPGPVVTDESVSQCIADIRRAIGDAEHRVLETLPKRGYRLHPQPIVPSDARRPIAIVLAALLVTGAALHAMSPRSDEIDLSIRTTAAAERPSLAVLPFADGSDALLANGFATDLAIALTTLHGVDIVPSSAAMSYDPAREPLHTIADKLGTRYLVTGTLRRRGERLRVSVELVDSASGHIAWAESYDGVTADLFAFQDRTLSALTDALSLMLSDDERTRLSHHGTDVLAAYNEFLLGRRAVGQLTRETNFAAEKHFRRALEIAPDYARALAHLAETYVLRIENDWSSLPADDAAKARHFAHRATQLDDRLAFAEYVLGRLPTVERDGDLAAAASHLQRAMQLAPGDDDARVYLAVVRLLRGEAHRALPILDDVMAGHPAPPFFYHLAQGHAFFLADRLEEANAALERCLWQMPTAPYCLRFQIMTLGALGRSDDASWAVAEYEALGHTATVRGIMNTMIDREADAARRFLAALRAAGLPET